MPTWLCCENCARPADGSLPRLYNVGRSVLGDGTADEVVAYVIPIVARAALPVGRQPFGLGAASLSASLWALWLSSACGTKRPAGVPAGLLSRQACPAGPASGLQP